MVLKFFYHQVTNNAWVDSTEADFQPHFILRIGFFALFFFTASGPIYELTLHQITKFLTGPN